MNFAFVPLSHHRRRVRRLIRIDSPGTGTFYTFMQKEGPQ